MRRRGRLQHEHGTEEGTLHGYHVIYERTPNGWSAYAPDLPGLGGGAESREEMERLMDEAIPMHLEALRRDRAERPWLYAPENLSPELRAVFARIDAA
jgi:predicted RNase H-like HicB family nuclease